MNYLKTLAILILSLSLEIESLVMAEARPEEAIASAAADPEVIFAEIQARKINQPSQVKTVYDIPDEQKFSYLLGSASIEIFDIKSTVPVVKGMPVTINVIGIQQNGYISGDDEPGAPQEVTRPITFNNYQTRYIAALKKVTGLNYFSYDPKLVDTIKFYQGKGVVFYRLYNRETVYEMGAVNKLTVTNGRWVVPTSLLTDLTTLVNQRAALKNLSATARAQLTKAMKTEFGRTMVSLLGSVEGLDSSPAPATSAASVAGAAANASGAGNPCDSIDMNCPKVNIVKKYSCIPPGGLTPMPYP